jgi:hypothetical protein
MPTATIITITATLRVHVIEVDSDPGEASSWSVRARMTLRAGQVPHGLLHLAAAVREAAVSDPAVSRG